MGSQKNTSQTAALQYNVHTTIASNIYLGYISYLAT